MGTEVLHAIFGIVNMLSPPGWSHLPPGPRQVGDHEHVLLHRRQIDHKEMPARGIVILKKQVAAVRRVKQQGYKNQEDFAHFYLLMY